MNNQLLTKIIKYNSKSLQEFVYDSPLLDRNVASELSRSFVKILNSSKQNSVTNNNLRFCVLENIRKLANVQPKGHYKLNETSFEALIELFSNHLNSTQRQNEEDSKKLQAFLIRNLSDCDIESDFSTEVSPEVMQALLNLSEKDENNITNSVSLDVIHWKNDNPKWYSMIKNIWSNSDSCNENIINDTSFKMRAEIEKQLLTELCTLLTFSNDDIEIFVSTNSVLKLLVCKCSQSKECFRICIKILNYVFVKMNYDERFEKFIPIFIKSVYKLVADGRFPLLYPDSLQCLVILMDADPEVPNDLLINETLTSLRELGTNSENDVILLLSHFPQWVTVYLDFVDLNTMN